MHWIYLIIAILAEAGATTSMKLSEGFTKPLWAGVMTVGYAASFFFVTLAIKKIDLSLAYAVWAGVGTAAAALIGIYVFDEPITVLRVIGIAFVLFGVVLLRLAGVQ